MAPPRPRYPALIVAMARWIDERGGGVDGLGFELDNELRASLHRRGERSSCFSYPKLPFELLPFGWQGGDALQYGHLVHAPELERDELPVGSFSPADDAGVVWLGDDTRGALQNLVSANLRIAAEDPEWGGSVEDYLANRAFVAFCRKFDIRLEPAPDGTITYGGRSDRSIVPAIPPGWRYEPTRNRVGVLAKEDAFDPSDKPRPYRRGKLAPFVERAEKLLGRGFPASALRQLYEVHEAATLDVAGEGGVVLRRMRDAYEALGREVLARRVESYIDTLSTGPGLAPD
jgi:hypothetical protein